MVSHNFGKFNLFCILNVVFVSSKTCYYRSQWPRGLKGGSAAARLLGLRAANPGGVTDVFLL
jgi:hypothetical protein